MVPPGLIILRQPAWGRASPQAMARDIETGPGTPTTASVVDPEGAQTNKDRQTGGVVEDAKVEAKGGGSGGVGTGIESAPGQHLSWRVEEYSTHAGAWGRGPAVRVLHEISKYTR